MTHTILMTLKVPKTIDVEGEHPQSLKLNPSQKQNPRRDLVADAEEDVVAGKTESAGWASRNQEEPCNECGRACSCAANSQTNVVHIDVNSSSASSYSGYDSYDGTDSQISHSSSRESSYDDSSNFSNNSSLESVSSASSSNSSTSTLYSSTTDSD